MYASSHAIAFSSAHIASGPGPATMHVKPLVPFLSVRIFMSSPIATTVASLAIAAGPPDSAFLISCWSVGPDFAAGGGLVFAWGGGGFFVFCGVATGRVD